MDECYAKVEVALVTADQAGAEEDANRNYGSEVNSGGYSDCFAAIEESGRPCQDLSHDRGEEEMPTC